MTAFDPLRAVRAHRRANAARILRDFHDLLAIPNTPGDGPNIRRNAAHIAEAFEGLGVKMEMLSLDGAPDAPPALYGEIRVPDAEGDLGIYAHYDGQPADEGAWTNGAWNPTLSTARFDQGGEVIGLPRDGEKISGDWRMYARSAADDKAPIIAILTALEGLAEADLTPRWNLKFLIEGEEEASSPNLERYVQENADRLDADAWLFCDGPCDQFSRPQFAFGVRGDVELDLTVYGPLTDLHSGHYGNWAPNPAMALTHLLASMRSAAGEALIEGFYDDVAPYDDAASGDSHIPPEVEAALRHNHGLATSEAANAPYLERIMRPSLNLRGMRCADVGVSARNVVPSEAHASIDIRLVQGNDPARMQRLVEEHCRREGFHVVHETPDAETRRRHERIVKVTYVDAYPAVRTSMRHAMSRSVIEAGARAAGQPMLCLPTLGGSMPLHVFDQAIGAPTIVTPMANYDNNQHGADENLRVGNLWYGIDMLASLMTMPAAVATAGVGPTIERALSGRC